MDLKVLIKVLLQKKIKKISWTQCKNFAWKFLPISKKP